MEDAFTPYETGLKRLLERLGEDHPLHAKVLDYQKRLQENIAKARKLSVQADGAVSENRAPQQEYLAKLWQILSERFNESELRTLCFELDEDYEDLPPEGKAGKARELVRYFERRKRIPELVRVGKRMRPDVSWEDVPEAIKHGDTDELERERTQIMDALKQLALKELGVDFNDLCITVSRIQVILEGGISDFTDERRAILRDVLASVLRVEPSDVRILRVQSARSIRVTVEVPEEELARLTPLSRADRSLLVDAGIQTIESDATGTLNLQSELPLPFTRRLLLNFVFFVIVLAFLLRSSVSLPYVSPQASVVSLAVILLLLFHLIWRLLAPVIREFSDSIEVGSVAVPIRVLVSLLDALHLWIRPDWVSWVLSIILFAAAVVLGLSPVSPFRIEETPPIVQKFCVHHADGSTETFAVGDFVKVRAYTQVLVEAAVSDQAEVSCRWFAVKGMQLPARGCATLYSPPLEGNRDALSVLAESPGKTWQTFAGLHINVLQVQP